MSSSIRKIKVGKKCVIESSPSGVNNKYQTFFEDDGDTGYFYACDTSQEMPIQDALHIYNVKDVLDRRKPSEVAIMWSPDNKKSMLLINDYPHALIDFERKIAYCRTGFPPQKKNSVWSPKGHEWDEEDFVKLFEE